MEGRWPPHQRARALALLAVVLGLAHAAPALVPGPQARADFFDYVSPTAQVTDLRVYHGADSGAGDPLIFTFRAERGFTPQPVSGTTLQPLAATSLPNACPGFGVGRLIRSERVRAPGRSAERLTYQNGPNFCVVVNGAELFLTRAVSLPPEFTRYVIARPNQIRSLNISGSEFQETRLVLRFVAVGAVSFPSGPSLKVAALAEARRVAKGSECALLASRAEQISLVSVPDAATSVGRLVVRGTLGSGRNDYCVLVWNTDR